MGTVLCGYKNSKPLPVPDHTRDKIITVLPEPVSHLNEAPLADRVDSVLEASLTKTQRALLGKIYFFAHGKEPDFEMAA